MTRKRVILADRAGLNGAVSPPSVDCKAMVSEYKFRSAMELQKQLTELFQYLDYLKRNPTLPRGEAQNKIDNANRKGLHVDKRLHVFANQPGRKRRDPVKWALVTGLVRIWEQQTDQPATCYYSDYESRFTGDFLIFVKEVSKLGNINIPSGSLVCKILKETSKPTVSWLPEDYYRRDKKL